MFFSVPVMLSFLTSTHVCPCFVRRSCTIALVLHTHQRVAFYVHDVLNANDKALTEVCAVQERRRQRWPAGGAVCTSFWPAYPCHARL